MTMGTPFSIDGSRTGSRVGLRLAVSLLVSMASLACMAATSEVFVDGRAAAGGDGSASRPLRSLAEAQQKVRSLLKASGSALAGIEVRMAEGVYPLQETLEFDARDSLDGKVPVIYTAADGAAVTLSGAVELGTGRDAIAPTAEEVARFGFRAAGIRKLVIRDGALADEAMNLTRSKRNEGMKAAPQELLLDGEMQQLARWPNSGWARVHPAGGELRPEQASLGRVKIELEQAAPAQWRGTNVWLRGYFKWDWYDETFPLVHHPGGGTSMELRGKPVYGIKDAARVVVLNEPSELDAPGEYYLDNEGSAIYFVPAAAGEAAKLSLTELKSAVVEFDGASNITFKNIAIEGGRADGIVIRNSQGIHVTACTLQSFGGTGIVIQGGVDNTVTDSLVRDVGTAGIMVSGGDRRKLTSSQMRVSGNHIERVGRLSSAGNPAVAVNGVGVVVANNRINDVPHAAIIVPGNDHVVEGNEIFGACAEAADCGAIYLGRDWTSQGTQIRYNYVHDSPGLAPGASVQAVYLDDFTSNVTVYGNVAENIFRGVLVGGGRDNVVKNNYLAHVRVPVSIDARGTHWGARLLGPGSSIVTKLQAMPYRAAPWRDRYPQLAGILDDQPALPKRNTVADNFMKESGAMSINALARVSGVIENNWEDPAGYRAGAGGGLQAAGDSAKIQASVPGWSAIPIAKIGRSQTLAGSAGQ